MRKRDGLFPWTYLGKPIEDTLAEIGMTLDEFLNVCDHFTNKRLFKCDNRGNLIKDADGNPLKVNDDNP